MKSQLEKWSHTYRWVIQPLLVIGILLFGFFGAMGLSMFKDQPQSQVEAAYAPLVQTLTTQIADKVLVVNGNGVVNARTRIDIIPQVGGQVVKMHPQLRAGGRFKAEDVLFELERVDFELAIIQARKELATAEKNLQVELAEERAALQDWQNLNFDKPIPPLVARKPQIKEALAGIEAAKANIRQARVNLKRTQVSLPFNGRVVEATIDRGKVVTANQSIGSVYSDDVFEIPVPLEVDQLAWVEPYQDPTHPGTSVKLKLEMAGKRLDLPAHVERIQSELDSISRLAKVIVSLPSQAIPAELKDKVIPGLFVNVEFELTTLSEVTTLPSSVMREDAMLWLVKEEQLAIVKPEIVHKSDSEIIVRGLPANSLVVTSTLDVVTDNMQVRTKQTKNGS